MRSAARKRTICEVLREINDLHQGDTQIDITARALLYEAILMAKRMDHRLKEYNQEWDSEWWDNNPDYEKDFERRLAIDYIALDEIPDEVRRIPSMGGREIARYLREWAADVRDGEAIVELGSWLGAGTAQLAMGAKDRAVWVHAFDKFEASQSEIGKAADQGVVLQRGDTREYIRSIFEKIGIANVVFHKGRIESAKWEGQKIALYVDDACKREKAFTKALTTFSPFWIPGRTVIVFMDYWYFKRFHDDKGLRFQHDWMMEHSKCFEKLMNTMPGTSGSAFRYLGGL